MRTIGRIFLTGLATVVPLALTIALLVWLGVYAEALLGGAVKWILPDAWVFPGLGVLLGVGVVFGVGVLMQAWVVRRLFDLGEALLERIPLVKTVYGSIKDVMQMLSRRDGSESGKPVVVRLPGHEESLIGFVTREALSAPYASGDTVAVYLPMSYQIGGYTLLLPRENIQPLETSANEAMRFVLTAGMGVSEKSDKPVR